MTRLNKAVGKAAKPKAIIFCFPNLTTTLPNKLQLQDWLELMRRGIADEVIVQLYRPDLPSFAAEALIALNYRKQAKGFQRPWES